MTMSPTTDRHRTATTSDRSTLGWALAVLVLVGAAGLGSGCAHRRMQTSRQLDPGESHSSIALEAPGILGVPRVSHQSVWGNEGGDSSFHIGTSVFSLGVGGGVRRYIDDLLTFESHLLVRALFFGGDGTVPSQLFAYPRVGLSTSTDGNRIVYAGTDVHGTVAMPPSAYHGVLHTVRVGVEPQTSSTTSLQIELTVPTVGWFSEPGLVALHPSAADPSNPHRAVYVNGVQLGIGFNWSG